MALKRDRYGRPMITPPDGSKQVPYTRATTVAGALDDGYGLVQWKLRMAVAGIIQRPDLLLKASTIIDDKTGMDGLIEAAMEAAGATKAATIGTAVHAMTEKLDKGEPLGFVLDDYKPDLIAYEKATKNLRHLHIEQMSVQDEFRIAGTPDRVSEYKGEYFITDLKTGSIEYPHHMAIQLGIYANSKPYDVDSNTRSEWSGEINKERAIIIHLPAGTGNCTLHFVDIKKGWESLQLAMEVRQWRSVRKLTSKIMETNE